MRTRIVFWGTLIFCTLLFSSLSAQERYTYTEGIPWVQIPEGKNFGGEVIVTPMAVDFKGQKAKFNEYRDLRDGVYGAAALRYDSDRYYLDFGAADVGYRTQRYELDGGWWGTGKFHLGFDQIPHNFTYGARSFYRGIGGSNLTSPFPVNTNVSTWNRFDYAIDRRNYEAGFKLDLIKPFFLDVAVNKVEKKGIYPLGAAGTSPGGIGIELPTPIDYTTNNLKVEAGYSKNPLFLSFSYYYSDFDNGNQNLNFTNVATANTASTTDTFTLPKDNNYYKLNFKGAVKLPWNSKFNADVANSHLSSNAVLSNSLVDDVTAAASNIGIQGRRGITLSKNVFNGKVEIQNYAFSLTSNPFYWLDGKLFYKYYKRDNNSDQIITIDTISGTVVNDLVQYYKEQGGAQVGFTLPWKFYLSGMYTRAHTKRIRPPEDIPRNDDDIVNLDLRWSGLDWMVARVGYEWLHRDADFKLGGDTTDIEAFIRRYDAAAKERNAYKATLDFFPIEDLSLSIGGKYKDTEYKKTILGLRADRRGEISLDADYLIFKRVRLFGNFDYERVKWEQKQRQITIPPFTGIDPGLAPAVNAPTGANATGTGNFNWKAGATENNYAYGVGTDIYIIPNKLTLRLQYNSVKSDGTVDYTYMMSAAQLSTNAPGRTQENIDVGSWDSYRLQYYLAKVTYFPIKPLALTFGYAYEKYIYDDAQYNGYLFVPTGPTGAVLDYLTGAYANPNYKANIFFLSAAYQF